MMRVIFLDIDGVMNAHDSFYAENGKEVPLGNTLSRIAKRPAMLREMDPCKVALLALILNENPEVKLVLSSTWRLHYTTDQMDEIMHTSCSRWPKGRFLGRTVEINGPRGREIKVWLSEHPEVTHYAILDDNSDMLQEQRDHFIQTDFCTGFSGIHAYALTRVLDIKCPSYELSMMPRNMLNVIALLDRLNPSDRISALTAAVMAPTA